MNKEDLMTLPLAAIGVAAGAWKYGVRPELTAKRGWLGMGLGILAYELCAPTGELLSEGVDRALENHKVAVIGAVCLTAAHLVNVLPERLDPLHQAVEITRRLLGQAHRAE